MSSAPLYNADILRLAASIPHQRRLDAPQASVELRSPTCGSRLAVDVVLDAAGRVMLLGLEAKACALGQASASLMASHAIGRTVAELEGAAASLRALLSDCGEDAGFWPGIALLARARDYPARHPSILLAFDAVATAARQALDARGVAA